MPENADQVVGHASQSAALRVTLLGSQPDYPHPRIPLLWQRVRLFVLRRETGRDVKNLRGCAWAGQSRSFFGRNDFHSKQKRREVPSESRRTDGMEGVQFCLPSCDSQSARRSRPLLSEASC